MECVWEKKCIQKGGKTSEWEANASFAERVVEPSIVGTHC